MSTDQTSPTPDSPPAPEPRPGRPSGRLRAMIAFNVLALGLYVFVRLDRSAAERLGPVGEAVYDLFNQVPGKAPPLSPGSRRLSADVKAMGGEPSVHVTKLGYFGTFGQEEWANISFHNASFDDAALARLAETYGDRIGGLYLDNTGVTDAGLKSLDKFTMLRHLQIHDFPISKGPGVPARPPKVTDAGMVHLKGLDHLWSLDLSGLPITDAGLEAIDDLPNVMSLYLNDTKVEGRGLARLKSLTRLNILYLDGSRMTEDGLKALWGAPVLQLLSLSRVPLTPDALPLFKAIPMLDRLEITGCGFLDEEVAALSRSLPKLRIIRQ